MRSIGSKNIKLVKRLAKAALEKRRNLFGIIDNYSGLAEEVIHQLPESIFDTWECAYQEINRIIDDVIFE